MESPAFVAAMLHVPVLASIVTSPVPELTEHTPGDVLAKTTAPEPFPPVVPSVTVEL